jgi:two-component system sensor histidine kinase KdpD
LLRLGNFINRLIRYSGNIDVYILGSDIQSKDRFREKVSLPPFTSNIRQYLISSIIIFLTAVIAFPYKNI